MFCSNRLCASTTLLCPHSCPATHTKEHSGSATLKQGPARSLPAPNPQGKLSSKCTCCIIAFIGHIWPALFPACTGTSEAHPIIGVAQQNEHTLLPGFDSALISACASPATAAPATVHAHRPTHKTHMPYGTQTADERLTSNQHAQACRMLIRRPDAPPNPTPSSPLPIRARALDVETPRALPTQQEPPHVSTPHTLSKREAKSAEHQMLAQSLAAVSRLRFMVLGDFMHRSNFPGT